MREIQTKAIISWKDNKLSISLSNDLPEGLTYENTYFGFQTIDRDGIVGRHKIGFGLNLTDLSDTDNGEFFITLKDFNIPGNPGLRGFKEGQITDIINENIEQFAYYCIVQISNKSEFTLNGVLNRDQSKFERVYF